MSNTAKKWFVLYIKPRNELKLADQLSAMGINVFAPSKNEIWQWSDGQKKIRIPLLLSIVLVKISEQDASEVFALPGAVRYLFEGKKRVVVLQEEILAMKHYLDNNFNLKEKKTSRGDVVKVPLLGQEAMLLSIKGEVLWILDKLSAFVSFQLS